METPERQMVSIFKCDKCGEVIQATRTASTCSSLQVKITSHWNKKERRSCGPVSRHVHVPTERGMETRLTGNAGNINLLPRLYVRNVRLSSRRQAFL